MSKNIYLLLAIAACTLMGCSQDKLNERSIFEDVPVLDSTSYTYEFDKWLEENYRKPYNIKFQYKLPDGSTDMEYNLVPVNYDKAIITAHAIKYLWIDVYNKQLTMAGDPNFVKKYTPRIINVLGSPAMNASQGTETLGVAEGGVKITLYNMNDIKLTNVAWLNKYIYHVMHHEFSHILHQTKTFPKEYETISAGKYDAQAWQYHSNDEAYKNGFVTPYSMSEAHEDFVEVISSYITDTREVWAKRGFIMSADHTHLERVDESVWPDGTPVMNTKITKCKEWLRAKYGYELDSIRAEVQRRQDYLIQHPTIEAMDNYDK